MADITYKLNFTGDQINNLLTRVNNLDTDAVIRKAAPKNLLDNSDFRNPVNQRGATSYTGTGAQIYTIDRWFTWSPYITVSLQNGYLSIANNSDIEYQQFAQAITSHNLTNKAITIAVWDGNDGVYCSSGILEPGKYISVYSDSGFWTTAFISDNDNIIFYIQPDPRKTCNIKAVALYEGTYTAETLPEYQPKGYGAELAECLRYFQRIGDPQSEVLGDSALMLSGSSAFICSVSYYPKRLINPTVKLSNVSNYRALMHHAESGVPYGSVSIASFDNIYTNRTQAKISVNIDRVVEANSIAFLQRQDNVTQAYIDICADL